MAVNMAFYPRQNSRGFPGDADLLVLRLAVQADPSWRQEWQAGGGGGAVGRAGELADGAPGQGGAGQVVRQVVLVERRAEAPGGAVRADVVLVVHPANGSDAQPKAKVC